jgi:type IV secretion system T-DNA border endonuclease VirD2
MARNNAAVAAAQNAFFDRDWSRISGSVPRARQKQMVRAAMGHSPAIFKAIRSGGTHTRAQLRNQLGYLTSKSSMIIDSRGTYDGQERLSEKEAEQVTRRFAAQWNEGFNPKLGHTSHLLMAFPIGTRGEDVGEITREICERFFQGEGSHFDYIAAVHEDRDHPHAHVVLNRRSKDGEVFFLKQDHHFNYDAFREAMVEVSDRYGLRLEATRRAERGVVTKAPADAQVRRAMENSQTVCERERVGPELDRALAEIAGHARLYRGLAAEASRETHEEIATALNRAATLLGQGQAITADGKVYGMAEDQLSFDEVVDAFHDKIAQAERVVAEAPPDRRVALEHELNEIYRDISHLSPIGSQSHTLMDAPSASGVYSTANIDREAAERLQAPELAERVERALEGTGISAQDVIARVELGADNAALERQWLSQDLKAIAETEGLDLTRADQLEAAIDRLDAAHGDLGRVLAEAEVLRDSGAVDEAERMERVVRDPDIASLPPTTADVMTRLRDDPSADPFRDPAERAALREEIGDMIGEERATELAAGDDDALNQVLEDRLDRLYMAKAYLQSDAALANSAAMEHVRDEIANEEIDVQRARHAETDGEKGVSHG